MLIRSQADVETFRDHVVDWFDVHVKDDCVDAVIGGEALTFHRDVDVETSLCEQLAVSSFAPVYAYLRAVPGRPVFSGVVLGILDGIEL